VKIEKVKITEVKRNTTNPRVIKDDKFLKLVESIKTFPQMLEIRPIVVNDDMVVLGGNMRLKACQEAGLKEVFIIKANQLTELQQKEFIIKDNVGFGEWDWAEIANNWSDLDLGEWGLDLLGESISEEEYGEDFSLPDGDKAPFQQMTFTLADEQAEIIKEKIAQIKKRAEFNLIETYGNENSNGNALFALIIGAL
jgi:hypothetical protein